jgi:hypothetical protein
VSNSIVLCQELLSCVELYCRFTTRASIAIDRSIVQFSSLSGAAHSLFARLNYE